MPIRILHVVGCMNRGGLETWLMRVLRQIDRQQFQIDILTHSAEAGFYDAELRDLGSRVITCPYLSRPWRYAVEFRRLLQTQGSYDIVHSHVHCFSGYVLKLAKAAGVPCRIAHSHTNLRDVEHQTSWLRQGYVRLMKHWIQASATHGFATSQSAALDLFGDGWSKDSRFSLLMSGLDLKPFKEDIIPAAIRQSWGIPQDAFVIGHVGRFDPLKNHQFLVQVAAEVMRHRPNTVLMLVGEGTIRPDIERQVAAMNLGDRIIFTGPRSDIPTLLLGAFDAFIFPSFREGLGVALLEAQAAGLPCLVSDAMPTESTVIPHLVKRLSLTESASQWANTLLDHVQKNQRLPIQTTLPLLQQSSFNMENSVPLLTQRYTEAVYGRS
jgi:glycosyltransferase involved in cell wall biosynthesis